MAKKKTNKKTAGSRTTAASKSRSSSKQAGGARNKAASSKAKQSIEVRPTHDQIAARAYEIWLAEGAPTGRQEQHWLQAEKDIIRKA